MFPFIFPSLSPSPPYPDRSCSELGGTVVSVVEGGPGAELVLGDTTEMSNITSSNI
jgi:hypothetical protein